MSVYAITVNGKPEAFVSTEEAARIALQAIANAVARDIVLKIVEVSGNYFTRKTA